MQDHNMQEGVTRPDGGSANGTSAANQTSAAR
jgi:hypothetical protein